MMAGRPGEVSPRRAADILEMHIKTARRWIDEGRFQYVRRDATGHKWLSKAEVSAIRETRAVEPSGANDAASVE